MKPTKLRPLRSLLVGVAIATAGVAAYRLGDEALLSTDYELTVEREIGKKIYLSWGDRGKGRDRKVRVIERLHRSVSGSWDYFQQQWDKVPWIEIDDLGEEEIANTHNYVSIIEFNSVKGNIEESTLVHELAHAWYDSLTWREQDQLEEAWIQISRGAYHDCKNYEDPSCQQEDKTCEDFIRKAATTSCYGADSFDEDLAEVVEKVFLLNRFVRTASVYLQKVDPLSYQRVIAKIQLAGEFNFFSEREQETATTLIRTHFTRR